MDQYYAVYQKGTHNFLNEDGEIGPFQFAERFRRCVLAEIVAKAFGPEYDVVGPINVGEAR